MISTVSCLPSCPRFSYSRRDQPGDLPDRVAHAESLGQPAGEGFVDHDHPRRAGAIAVADAAALHHRNVERLEVPRIDPLEADADAVLRARNAQALALPDAEQRHVRRDRGALHAGNRAQPFRERVDELDGAFGVG